MTTDLKGLTYDRSNDKSEKVKKRSGVFTRDDEQELWASIEPGMRDHFLRLMEKFDISSIGFPAKTPA